MRNIVILNSLHFSYPLPILMRVSYNTLIVKQNTSDYYKYNNFIIIFHTTTIAYSVTSLAKSFEKYHKVYLQQPLTINHQFKTDIQKLGSLPT